MTRGEDTSIKCEAKDARIRCKKIQRKGAKVQSLCVEREKMCGVEGWKKEEQMLKIVERDDFSLTARAAANRKGSRDQGCPM